MRQTRSTHISPPTSKSPSKYIRKKISKNLYTQVYRLIPRYTHRIAESLQIFILYLTCVCVLSEKDGFSVETRSMCWKEKGDHQSPKARMGAATCDVRANQQFLLLLLFICFFFVRGSFFSLSLREMDRRKSPLDALGLHSLPWSNLSPTSNGHSGCFCASRLCRRPASVNLPHHRRASPWGQFTPLGRSIQPKP